MPIQTKQTVVEQPIEVIELNGRYYASSPTAGFYLVRLEDATHPPFCECPHHEHRLRGTRIDCKHLTAVRAFVAEKAKPRCPHCGQHLPECEVVPGLPKADHDRLQRRQAAVFGGRR